MREINNENESKHIYGGRTYHCPFGCNKSGGYLSVYLHCLTQKCFKRNRTLNGIYNASNVCFKLSKGIKNLIKK